MAQHRSHASESSTMTKHRGRRRMPQNMRAAPGTLDSSAIEAACTRRLTANLVKGRIGFCVVTNTQGVASLGRAIFR